MLDQYPHEIGGIEVSIKVLCSFTHTADNTFFVASQISGPIPSPGINTIFLAFIILVFVVNNLSGHRLKIY